MSVRRTAEQLGLAKSSKDEGPAWRWPLLLAGGAALLGGGLLAARRGRRALPSRRTHSVAHSPLTQPRSAKSDVPNPSLTRTAPVSDFAELQDNALYRVDIGGHEFMVFGGKLPKLSPADIPRASTYWRGSGGLNRTDAASLIRRQGLGIEGVYPVSPEDVGRLKDLGFRR